MSYINIIKSKNSRQSTTDIWREALVLVAGSSPNLLTFASCLPLSQGEGRAAFTSMVSSDQNDQVRICIYSNVMSCERLDFLKVHFSYGHFSHFQFFSFSLKFVSDFLGNHMLSFRIQKCKLYEVHSEFVSKNSCCLHLAQVAGYPAMPGNQVMLPRVWRSV